MYMVYNSVISRQMEDETDVLLTSVPRPNTLTLVFCEPKASCLVSSVVWNCSRLRSFGNGTVGLNDPSFFFLVPVTSVE